MLGFPLFRKSFHDSRFSISACALIDRKNLRFIRMVLVVLALSLLTSACATLYDPQSSQESNSKVIGVLTPEKQIGQSFISRRPRLNNIQLWLRENSPGASPDAILWLHLYHSPQDQHALLSIPVPYATLASSFPVNIAIEPQNDPAGQSYYLEFETDGADLLIYGRPEEAYTQGNFIVNGIARETDMALRLSYDYGLAAILGDLWLVFKNIWLVIPLALVFWLPGYLLFDISGFSRREDDFDWGEQAALAVGLSLAVVPLVLLWTSSIGITWTRSLVVIIFSLAGILLLWRIWRKRRSGLPDQKNQRRVINPISLALAAIFLFTLGVRLAMVRDQAAPPWVDPVHHATITRLILENDSYPQNYEPYVSVDTAGYHPGFHASLAAFLWLSVMGLDDGMLLYGQVLNALMVFSVYLFTTSLTKNKIAALIAALICAVFSPMPAYYTSWGRYTQLAGLVILPAACTLILKSWEHHRKTALVILAAICCAGMFIVHYRVIVFLGALLISLLLGKALESAPKKDFLQLMTSRIAVLSVITLAALLLTIPQCQTLISSAIVERVSPGKSAVQPFADFSWGILTTAYGRQAMILAGLGLLLSLLRARWFGPVLALWVSLLFLIANPMRINLPGAGLVNNISVEIALFLPVAVLGGYLIASLLEAVGKIIGRRWQALYWCLAASAGIFLALAGAQKLMPILNPVTMLSRQADRPAIEWIAENIAQDETILINPFKWGYGLYAGQDGGYWITPLSGRKTMPPPALYGVSGGKNIFEINRICKRVIAAGDNPGELYEIMDEHGLHYVYTGVRGEALSAQALRESHLFSLIYTHEGVNIFKRELSPTGD